MNDYTILNRNPFFEALGGLNAYNRSDDKVGMIVETDMSSATRLRARQANRGLRKPSFTALVTRAVALALRKHPYANRIPYTLPGYRRIVQLHHRHIMVAVEKDSPGREQAVFVGMIPDADRRNVEQITTMLFGLANATEANCREWRTMNRILRGLPPWLARRVMALPFLHPRLWLPFHGGSVLISSPAKYGIDTMIGTWPWPLGISFGLVKDRPVGIRGTLQLRPTMNLTLSFDRRLMGGAPAARFIKTVSRYLEGAETLLVNETPPDSVEMRSTPAALVKH